LRRLPGAGAIHFRRASSHIYSDRMDRAFQSE
jgi:hypothetical protein